MKQSRSLRTALIDYVQTLWLQFAHTAAANAHGTIEQRLARLLLVVEERLDSDEINITHEQLATMLACDELASRVLCNVSRLVV